MRALGSWMRQRPDVWGYSRSGASIVHENSTATILFTSESKSAALEKEVYAASTQDERAMISSGFKHGPIHRDKNVPLMFHFLSNTHDVAQDTGNIGKVTDIDADSIMLSAISTLQFQLLARMTVANCCSSFHILIGLLLEGGCGAARHNDFYCMQENREERLRMCCHWQPGCIAKMKQTAVSGAATKNVTRGKA